MRAYIELAKMAMELMPYEPQFNLKDCKSELINHKNFKNTSYEDKLEILYNMAKEHYANDQTKPFDLLFPDYSLPQILKGKTILDLGCWCGGKAVSMAERWNTRKMYGLDVNNYFIEAAQIFSASRENKNIKYDFRVERGEALPYEDYTFDAIVISDVFEHVQSLKKTLEECKRVLKPRGWIFCSFPSYYFPFNGAHLSMVTNTPFIQWFFGPKTLMAAYHEILNSRGESAYWYKMKETQIGRNLAVG